MAVHDSFRQAGGARGEQNPQRMFSGDRGERGSACGGGDLVKVQRPGGRWLVGTQLAYHNDRVQRWQSPAQLVQNVDAVMDPATGKQKINWIPRPQISCAQDIAEGMGIRTESPLVKECRNGVMEFLLINHPLDCPICDQAGECHLQEYSVEYGTAGADVIELTGVDLHDHVGRYDSQKVQSKIS